MTDTTKFKTPGDQTLYAHWRIKTPTVTYDYNRTGAGGKTQTQKVTYGVTYGTQPTPTWTGRTFDGWYTAASGGTRVESDTPVTNGDNHTLFAHWTARSVTITLDPKGGTMTGDTTITRLFGATYFPLPTPTREGYTFKNWVRGGRDLGLATYQPITNTSTVSRTEPHTLYTEWTPQSFWVTFRPQASGVSTPTSQTVTAGSRIARPTLGERTGYTFEGWYKEAACTTPWDFSADTVTENVTLYGKWTRNEYVVSFYAGTGAFSTDGDKDGKWRAVRSSSYNGDRRRLPLPLMSTAETHWMRLP